MRKSASLLVVNLMFSMAACESSGSPDDMMDDTRTGEGAGNGDGGDRAIRTDASNPLQADAGTTLDASAPSTDATFATDTSADAAPGASPDASTTDGAKPPDTAQPHAQCEQPLATASSTCGGADLFEPNDKAESAIEIPTSTGCAVVPAKLSSARDDDWYLFSSPKADPVRLEVAYETTTTGAAQLAMTLVDSSSGSQVYSSSGREDVTWTLSRVTVVKRNIGYQLHVEDRGSIQGCQGYNLRIDTQFCTDAFEDNDSRSEASTGLTLGAMLSATAYLKDEDWYDVSAFGASGANCTVSAQFAGTSAASLDVQTHGPGGGSYIHTKRLDAQTPSGTLTLEAGSTSLLSIVEVAEAECVKYTVLCTPL